MTADRKSRLVSLQKLTIHWCRTPKDGGIEASSSCCLLAQDCRSSNSSSSLESVA
jgi:hypothetical protein